MSAETPSPEGDLPPVPEPPSATPAPRKPRRKRPAVPRAGSPAPAPRLPRRRVWPD
ncbi:hypothetical protein [Marichromatium purpuratum]|uniref:hypothetical protein n=1 Tax=Marichromatium purpuratum TaxID=37487 RepID=UPI0012EBF2B3|nr:hypothetical protein [Marichromatium purpuratum]